ncbi:hypothetical protein [Atopobacter phocae]|uniref:hypothetical protein n=1 Tax=Atopobacter phocae TaxID=136492 RepID=UPI000472E69A|nr:hypothetical protein [Atopobacter phocae]
MQKLKRYKMSCIVLTFISVILMIALLVNLAKQQALTERNNDLEIKLTGAYHQLERAELELEEQQALYDELAKHAVEAIGIK